MRPRFVAAKPAGLMLTSLLDMFTIILIFLIVSFEAEDYDFKLNSDITLPDSSARSVLKPAVDIAITPTALIVDKKEVGKLEKGRFTTEEYDSGEVKPLVEVLKKRYEVIKSATEDEETEVPEGEEAEDKMIIVVQADKSLDYDTIYLVLRSSALAGFTKYRLAIMKK